MTDRFTFYKSFYDGIELLADDDLKLKTFDVLCRFAFYGELPPEDLPINVKLATLSPLETIKSGIEKREAGKRGGRPAKEKAEQ